MKRFATASLSIVLMWTFLPGLGEVLENVAHWASEGHMAHAASEGDEHGSSGPEHGCAGAVHLCSCHVSLSYLASAGIAQLPQSTSAGFDASSSTRPVDFSIKGIDHPPRA